MSAPHKLSAKDVRVILLVASAGSEKVGYAGHRAFHTKKLSDVDAAHARALNEHAKLFHQVFVNEFRLTPYGARVADDLKSQKVLRVFDPRARRSSTCSAGAAARMLHGRSRGLRARDFDARQLAAGTRVEMEHTKCRAIAERIAMDHLTEDPNYYRKLRRIHRHDPSLARTDVLMPVLGMVGAGTLGYFAGKAAGHAVYGRRRHDPRKRPARRDPYPQWTPHYSGEDFDRAQRLATELTESDRRSGLPTERHGYSLTRFREAERIVRAARRDPTRRDPTRAGRRPHTQPKFVVVYTWASVRGGRSTSPVSRARAEEYVKKLAGKSPRIVPYRKDPAHKRARHVLRVKRRDPRAPVFGPRPMNLADARGEMRRLGLVLTKKDSEYRVNFRGGREATAYYTNDLWDAVMTGTRMHQQGARR